jgi:hypothetical protein
MGGRAASAMVMTVEDREAFGDFWNRHDVDSLMGFMSDP